MLIQAQNCPFPNLKHPWNKRDSPWSTWLWFSCCCYVWLDRHHLHLHLHPELAWCGMCLISLCYHQGSTSNQVFSLPDRAADLDPFQFEAPPWQSDSIKPWFTERAKNKEGGKKKCPTTTKIHTPENNFLLWIFKTSGWRIAFSFLCCLSSQ